MTFFYAQNENLVNFEAWKWASKTSLDFDESKSIANEAFVKASQTWNPELGKFSTHLANKMQGEVTLEMKRSYGTSQKMANPKPDRLNGQAIDILDPSQNAEEKLVAHDSFRDSLKSLSIKASLVVGLTLGFTTNVRLRALQDASDAKLRAGVRQYLIEDLGWTKAEIRKVFAEIKEVLG